MPIHEILVSHDKWRQFNENQRLAKHEFLKSLRQQIFALNKALHDKYEGSNITKITPKNVDILINFLGEDSVLEPVLKSHPGPEIDIIFDRAKKLIEHIPASSIGRYREADNFYKEIKEEVKHIRYPNFIDDKQEYLLDLKEKLNASNWQFRGNKALGGVSTPAHIVRMKAKLKNLDMSTSAGNVSKMYEAIKKIVYNIPPLQRRHKAVTKLYEQTREEMDGIPGVSFKKDKLDYLLELKAKFNEAHWNKKGKGFVGTKLPKNIKKMRTALSKINSNSDIKDINIAFNYALKTLQAASSKKPSRRDNEVHELYNQHLQKALVVDYKARTGSAHVIQEVINLPDPKTFLIGIRDKIGKAEWDYKGSGILGWKTPATIEKLRTLLKTANDNTPHAKVEEMMDKVKGILQAAVDKPSKDRSAEVDEFYRNSLADIALIKQYQRQMPQPESPREELPELKEFLDDLGVIRTYEATLSKKEFLFDFKEELAEKGWENKGKGAFGTKLPDGIDSLRKTVSRVDSNTSEAAIALVFDLVRKELAANANKPSKRRHADVDNLYKARFEQANQVLENSRNLVEVYQAEVSSSSPSLAASGSGSTSPLSSSSSSSSLSSSDSTLPSPPSSPSSSPAGPSSFASIMGSLSSSPASSPESSRRASESIAVDEKKAAPKIEVKVKDRVPANPFEEMSRDRSSTNPFSDSENSSPSPSPSPRQRAVSNSNPFADAGSLKEKLLPPNPFDEDIASDKDAKYQEFPQASAKVNAVEASSLQNKREYLVELNTLVHKPIWERKGQGIFSNKLPGYIGELRKALRDTVHSNMKDKDVNSVLAKTIGILRTAVKGNSSDRDKDVHKLYVTNLEKASALNKKPGGVKVAAEASAAPKKRR